MAKKIVGVFTPHTLKHHLYIFENGNKLYAADVSTAEAPETIVKLSKEYETIDVDLCGSIKYVEGIKKQIRVAEKTEYTSETLNINII